ncbi:uncharacterized protein LOC116737638 [Xiphophorus hellerii]|uniref:uncharacterized protein LOC116733658 n=1 Tax=Xiphophorus hellerii TaxID=8084 RepID=UPI0013B39327|nr:uncharacterized protein LOC116733658 [Xiphophorus hellerii]XP_032446832.1 uncharacterized protein LOC116737638 [Xiphophorus hellerii]
MGLNILLVPLHRVFLECQLFCGEALLAVRPALPIDGVSVILGNDLAGSSMWADESPTPSVGSEPESQNLDRQEENERELSNVFTACAVTRAMSRSQVNGDKDAQEENKDYKSFLPLADFPFPVTSTDLITDQRADSSLKELFQQVRPEGAVSDHEGGAEGAGPGFARPSASSGYKQSASARGEERTGAESGLGLSRLLHPA